MSVSTSLQVPRSECPVMIELINLIAIFEKCIGSTYDVHRITNSSSTIYWVVIRMIRPISHGPYGPYYMSSSGVNDAQLETLAI